MRRHPYFELWLHDDDELVTLLGGPLAERTTIHEWPLSCVQRLCMADGRRYIYKVQAGPTVEPTFYAHARSALLVQVQILAGPEDGLPAALLLEDVHAPRLEDVPLTEREAIYAAQIILGQIAQIRGDLPVVADIRSDAAWAAYATTFLPDLEALVACGTFHHVDRTVVETLRRHAEGEAVRVAITSPVGYVHQDLSGDNVLTLPDGYRVIDWQRPLWGPVALDRATLLLSLGVDPARHVLPGVLPLLYLLRIAWFTQCARSWFPAGAATYDTSIIQLAAQVDAASIRDRARL